MSSPEQLKSAQQDIDTQLQQSKTKQNQTKTKQKQSKTTPPGNSGIYLAGVKVYDEAALEGLLTAARANLAQLNGFDQTSLISHLGAIQGSTANQSQNALQITGPPQWGTATPTSPNTPNSPTLPAPSATYALPSAFQTSAADFLNEQMQLSMQMINLQLLLAGSFNDQFEQDSNIARIRTTLGFPINISVPPGFKYQGAVAEVEVSVCAPDTVSSSDLASNGGLSLVTLLPQEKTYNVASLVSKASSIGGGAVAGVVNVGGGVLRSRQTYYLVQDTDTLALQRFSQDSCDSTKDATKPVTFAWQFRPVLGQKVVRDGLRQTFAQVSFPRDVNTNLQSPLRILVRTGWRHYDPKTGRVGNKIDPFDVHLLKADRFDNPPSPLSVQANDNGDGTVTVMAMGAFKAGTRVRVGGVVQDNTVPGFEQNQRYLRFIAPVASLAIYGAYLLGQNGVEALLIDKPASLPEPPAIVHMDPPDAQRGKTIVRVLITGAGTHFQQGRTNVFSSGVGITVGNVTVIDDTHLTISLTVAPTAPPGLSDVTVTAGAETVIGRGRFAVEGEAPVAIVEPFDDKTSLVRLPLPSPPAFSDNPNELDVVIVGSHVFGLRDAPFYKRSKDEISVLVTNDLIRTNRQIVWKKLFTNCSQCLQKYQILFPPAPPTGISDFAVTGVTLVSYTAGSASSGPSGVSVASNVTVSTGSETATGTSLFTIGNGTPAITGISKASGQPGETLSRVTITGNFTHFSRRMPAVNFSNPNIVVGNLVVIDDTHLRMDLTVMPASPKGASNITVVTGSETAIGTGLFNVGTGSALIANTNPARGDRSQTLTVTITGINSHFVQEQSTVKFSNGGAVASNVMVIDPTHLTVTITIAANAQPGPSNVTVVTGPEMAIGTGLFAVAPDAPSLTSVSPAGGQQGQTLSGVVITGAFTHFSQARPAVTFSNPGITAANVVVNDDTHLTVTLNITPSAAAAASTGADTPGASQKPTNIYAISGSRLSGLQIIAPAGVPINEPRADTLVTFSLTDDQAKAFKSIVVQHNTDQPIVLALPPPPATPSATPPKPTIKAQPATGIAIGTAPLTVTGTGMSQVVSVRYLDTPLAFTSSSDTTLTIPQLPTLAPPGIEVVFVYADKSMAPYFIPVQTPGPK